MEDYLAQLGLEIDVKTFTSIYAGVKAALSIQERNRFPTEDFLVKNIFDGQQCLKIVAIYENCMKSTDPILKSAALRNIVIAILLNAVKIQAKTISVVPIWNMLYKSLTLIDGGNLQSSIGSQGFLSIPLYREYESGPPRKLIRLHIWDESLAPSIHKNRAERFAVHSHLCHAQSWIVCGEVGNIRYDVHTRSSPSALNRFSIKWRDSGNIHNKTSTAVNTGEAVDVKELTSETYRTEETYEIPSGEYHKSIVGKFTSATLFMFDADRGIVKENYVIGPADIQESEINRDQNKDTNSLLEKINNIINHG